MKTLILVPLFVATAASAQPTNGLVMHWPCNLNLNDASGNGLHGTALGVDFGPAEDRAGNLECAWSADHGGGRTADSELFEIAPDGGLAVSFWVYLQGALGSAVVIEVRPFQPSGPPQQGITMFMGSDGGIYFGSYAMTLSTTTGATNEQWHHVVCMYDDHRWSLHFDGVEQAYTVTEEGIVMGSMPFVSVYANPEDDLEGRFDDVRIYARGLSAAEITQLYTEQVDCTVAIGMEELAFADLVLSPNPTADRCELRFAQDVPSGTRMELYAPSGARVVEQPLRGNTAIMDLSGLASGVYLLRITGAGRTAARHIARL